MSSNALGENAILPGAFENNGLWKVLGGGGQIECIMGNLEIENAVVSHYL